MAQACGLTRFGPRQTCPIHPQRASIGAPRSVECTCGLGPTKFHAVTDANGRLLSFFITAGQNSEYIDAPALPDELPKAQWLLAYRRYDADWFHGYPWRTKASILASQARSPATDRSNTTNAAIAAVTTARLCSADRRTGVELLLAMIDAKLPFRHRAGSHRHLIAVTNGLNPN